MIQSPFPGHASRLVRCRESCPRARLHISLQVFLPGELRMRAHKIRSLEIHSAGMTRRSAETHLRCQLRVGRLVLDSSSHPKRWLPGLGPARRKVYMAIECALIRVFFIFVCVEMVGEKALSGRQVDLAFIFSHELFPA